MKEHLIFTLAILISLAGLVLLNFLPAKVKLSEVQKEYQSNLSKYNKNKGLSYEQLKKIPKRDRPDLAFMQDFEMTMDPVLGYPPIERRLKAFEDIRNINKNRIAGFVAISNVKWQERGPGNVGGRTRTIMFDPNDPTSKKVWAGAIGGGLWYNNDITSAQSKWQSVGDMMANMAISSIAYDPTNTSVFYMGTGLGYTSDIQGDGIFKSIDAGLTWTHLASTSSNSNFYFVQKIAVTSLGTLIATTRTGAFRSIDGGASWTNVQSGGMGDIEISSDNSIYVTQGYANLAGGIFKSTDDGLTWSNITPAIGNRTEIASAPSNPNILYAVADGGTGSIDVKWFKKSIDGGTSWFDIDIPKYISSDCSVSTDHFTRGQAFFDLILAVHPTNPDIAIVGGIDLHKTTDGGNTWGGVSYWTGGSCDDYVHADQHAIMFRPGYPNEAIFGNDGGISYSADVGNSSNPEFDERNNGYNVTTFYSVAGKNEINSNYFLAGAQDNGTQQFTEPGFGNTREATGGDGAFCFIDQDNSNIQITSYVYSNSYYSQDGGISFKTLHDDTANVGRFINPTEYDDTADILYGAGDIDEITRIDNLSTTPSALQTTTIALGSRQITTIKKSPYTANRLFVGVRIYNGEADLFIIDNANTSTPTVTKITGNYTGSHGGWVSSIDVGSSDNQLLATFSNYGVSSVYETIDGGVTWVDKNDNLPDIPVRYGLYNPQNRNQVLLATELGVWSTNDISLINPAWESTNMGLANVRCDMLKYRSADQLVMVATFGRGLYTTDVFATTIKADFKTKQIVGYVGVPVNFTDASLLPNGSWSWNFGDGFGVSNIQNPSYTYAAPGIYDVSLAIDLGADSQTKVGYVTILPVKPTPYLAIDGGDFETNTADYTSKSLLNGINHWERGVPTNKITTVNSGVSAWKTSLDVDIDDKGFDYMSALYTPAFNLTATDKNYKVKFKKSMSTIYCNSPHALQLQYSMDGGDNWIRLGSSFNEYGAVNWYNRGDNVGCSINRNIFVDKMGWSASNVNGTDNTVHNENTEFSLNALAGEPNISFRFVSSVGSGSDTTAYKGDGFMIDDFELITSNPTADFDANVTTAFIGQSVQFTSWSNGVITYAWDFGDGTPVSNGANPIHTYSAAGTYSVSLTITSAAGNVTQTKTNYMFVLPKRGSSYTLADGGDFETNTTDFGVQHIAGTSFELGKSSVTGKDGTASGTNAWVTGIADNLYADNSESRLLTPSFDFSNLGTYTIEFKSKFQFEDTWDGFIVEYSKDLGTNWVKLNSVKENGWYTTISDPQSVFGANVPFFSGNTAGVFNSFSTDVSFLAGNSNIVFRFLFLTDPASVDAGMALDDFILTGPVEGPAVPNFTFVGNTGCDGQIITFTNTSTGSISSLNWDFGINATPAIGAGLGPFEVTYSGTGQSTVTLSVVSPLNGAVTETKLNIISTAPIHTPTYIEEAVLGNEAQMNLVASAGDAFQWHINNTPIIGATNQIYLATVSGTYSVDVTLNGCLVNSGNNKIVTAINDQLFGQSIFVYPNPVSERVNLDISNDYIGQLKINVYDIKGVLFYNNIDTKDSRNYIREINVSDFKRGIYFVELQIDNQREIRKIILK